MQKKGITWKSVLDRPRKGSKQMREAGGRRGVEEGQREDDGDGWEEGNWRRGVIRPKAWRSWVKYLL